MRFILFLLPCLLNAAAPLTHLVLAQEFLKQTPFLQEAEIKPFLVGNVFPDIRYLGEISREETHEKEITLDDIFNAPSPFIAGMRLHALVDVFREDMVVYWNIYDLIEGESHPATLLKLIEDEILYEMVETQNFIPLFDEILTDELAWKVSLLTHHKWHYFLQRYLGKKPSQILVDLAERDMPYFNIPAETIRVWSTLVPQLAENEDLRNYVKVLMETFSLLFGMNGQTPSRSYTR